MTATFAMNCTKVLKCDILYSMKCKTCIRLLAVFACILFSFGEVHAEETLSEERVRESTSTVSHPHLDSFDALSIISSSNFMESKEERENNEVQNVLSKRPVREPGIFSFIAYTVQKAIALGIPANTIVLIFLIPVLATLITFVRVVIGLPSLDMLVPIVLSFVFVAIGVSTGLLILGAIILASFVSRTLLRKVPIMYFPKRSISHFFLALFVFMTLTIAVIFDIEEARNLSIFPILILTLLGDSIVSIQLRKRLSETFLISTVTIGLSLVGYLLAMSTLVRDLIILWPEVILLTIPVNVMLGRYFGLRLTEVLRFRSLESYVSK